MKRDMDLIRKILLTVEKEYKPGETFMFGLKVEDYDMPTIAEHCDLLYQQGFLKAYKPTHGGDRIQIFTIGNITASGYDYLDLIRDDGVWDKTKKEIEKQKIPSTFETIAKVAGVFVGNIIKELSG
ncbi:MAG: DUF2513 domain-containing protein [Chloroflexota bacterium]